MKYPQQLVESFQSCDVCDLKIGDDWSHVIVFKLPCKLQVHTQLEIANQFSIPCHSYVSAGEKSPFPYGLPRLSHRFPVVSTQLPESLDINPACDLQFVRFAKGYIVRLDIHVYIDVVQMAHYVTASQIPRKTASVVSPDDPQGGTDHVMVKTLPQ